MSNLSIEIKPNYTILYIEQADGTKEEKIIDNQSLRNLFTVAGEQVESTPLLPGEYGTQKIKTRGNRTEIYYLEPPALRRIKYHSLRFDKPEYYEGYLNQDDWTVRKQEEGESDTDYLSHLKEEFSEYQDRYKRSKGRYDVRFSIVTPRLLWRLDLRKTSDQYDTVNSYVYAMKQSIFTGNEELFEAPLGNVFSGNQKICWGNSTLRVPTLKSVQGASTLFFNSPFNSDLDNGRFVETDEYHTFLDLARYMDTELRNGTSEESLLKEIEGQLKRTNLRFSSI